MWDPPTLFPHRMRHAGDCAVASLAAVLGRPYAEVSRVARELDTKVLRRGLWTRQMVEIAEQFGVTLARARRFDLQEESGLLTVNFVQGRKVLGSHALVLYRGTLWDPETGLLWEPDAYLREASARACELLFPV